MRLKEIEFGSLLSYSSRGTDEKAKDSKQTMYAIKYDRMHGDLPMSEYIAKVMAKKLDTLPFAKFFTKKTALVPTPKSGLARPHSLWVPQRLVCSMQECDLGMQTKCLVRQTSVAKSSTSVPSKRPKPLDHYKSLRVMDTLDDSPDEIVIVDDVITRGSTLIGAAAKLAEVFPDAHIRGFAALRTVSYPDDFSDIFDPCIGKITINDGNAYARCSG